MLWAIAIGGLAGCSLDPVEIAAPRAVVAQPAAWIEGAPANARVMIRVRRSRDDGGGLGAVSDYAVFRLGDGGLEPFHYEEAKTEDLPEAMRDPRVRTYWDVTATPGERVQYVVYSLAERERMTFGNVGALGRASDVTDPVVASAPRLAADAPPPPPAPAPVRPPSAVKAEPVPHEAGEKLTLEWRISPDDTGGEGRVVGYRIMRAGPDREFEPFPGKPADPGGNVDGREGIRSETVTVPAGGPWRFQVWALSRDGASAASGPSQAVEPEASWLNPARLNVGVVLLLTIVLTLFFMNRARTGGQKIFIRRIPGVDAIEEAVGRATEMGRPILYVPGIDEIQDIQTIASILILGRVAETIARYDSEIRVPCCIPLVATVAEEVVRQGFYDAGRPDAHRPQNIQWISSEQFAFCAGTNGIMLRDKPATNIFLGRFFAESLILAETGYVNRAIQIAGTAEITQLPFFIAACDYTLIGEELFAVSAYMTREPRLLSTLKAADWIKAIAIGILIVGGLTAVFAPKSPIAEGISKMLKPGGD